MSTGPDKTAEDPPAADEAAGKAEAGEDDGDLEVAVEDGSDGDEGGELSVADAIEAKLETLEHEKKDLYERLLRTSADLDNLRKRSRREIEDARVEARSKVLRDMLPVMDNLERAVEHAEAADDGSAQSIIDGVKLVTRQFSQGLEKNGVKPIEALGVAFDPNLHEAMSQVETAEAEPGSVATVLQRGYTIGERLLRPSLVMVAKAPPKEEPPAGSNGKSAVAGDSGDGGGEDASEEPAADEPAAEESPAAGEVVETDDADTEDSEGSDDDSEASEGSDDDSEAK